MPANFVIDHVPRDMRALLEGAFGPPSPAVLAGSVFGKPVSTNPRYSAWEWSGCTVIAHFLSNATLNVIIEPTGTVNLRETCETVWRAVLKNGREAKPRLRSLTLDDGTSGHELAYATTGLDAHIKRPENTVAYITALVTLLWLAVGLEAFEASTDVVLGAIPAVVAGVVLAGLAIVYSWQKKLVWT